MDYENVLLVKNEVFTYSLPPRQSIRAHRAADWNLEKPNWTGRLRIIAKGKDLKINLEDRNTGELFASCPVDAFPGIAVESVSDSSRYFVIRLKADDGRTVFTGIGFADRLDSFDFNLAIQDHFKWLKQEEEVEQVNEKLRTQPSLDLGFKDGQKIKLTLNTRRTGDDSVEGVAGVPKPKLSVPLRSGVPSTGLLPPPPAPAVSRTRNRLIPAVTTGSKYEQTDIQTELFQQPPPNSNVNLLADIFGPSEIHSQTEPKPVT